MITMTPDVGNREVFFRISKMEKMTKKSIHNALFEIGKEHVDHAKELMLEKKTGRIYKIGKINHQASAPGEAPAILTRSLFSNLDYAVRGHQELEFGDKEQAGKLPIGKYLEEGTTNIEPRPHIGRTVMEQYRNTNNTLISYIKKANRQ